MDILDILDPLLMHYLEQGVNTNGFPFANRLSYRNGGDLAMRDSYKLPKLTIVGD